MNKTPLRQHSPANTSQADAASKDTTDLSITIKNGIATLSGTTDTCNESVQTERLVSQMHGVKQVINLIS